VPYAATPPTGRATPRRDHAPQHDGQHDGRADGATWYLQTPMARETSHATRWTPGVGRPTHATHALPEHSLGHGDVFRMRRVPAHTARSAHAPAPEDAPYQYRGFIAAPLKPSRPRRSLPTPCACATIRSQPPVLVGCRPRVELPLTRRRRSSREPARAQPCACHEATHATETPCRERCYSGRKAHARRNTPLRSVRRAASRR